MSNLRFFQKKNPARLAVWARSAYGHTTRLRLLPNTSIQKTRENCPAKGCGKPSHGKPYCLRHVTAAQRRVLPQEVLRNIRSLCCEASCTSGPVHDYGEQYCSKCKEPCPWKLAKM